MRLAITIQTGVVIASCIGALGEAIASLFAPGVGANAVDTMRGGASSKTVAITDKDRRFDPRPYSQAIAANYGTVSIALHEALARGSTPLLLACLLRHLDHLPKLLHTCTPNEIERMVWLLSLATNDPEFKHLWKTDP